MFYIGLVIGLFIGTFMGFVMAAMCQMARKSDEAMDTSETDIAMHGKATE